ARPVYATSTDPRAASPGLQHGQRSIDALITRFLDALQQKNWKALRRMRITESEYKQVILPGSVPPGQPLKTYRSDVSDYFWRVMNTKSAFTEQYLIATLGGGGPVEVKQMEYKKGRQDFARYTAYRQLRLLVVSPTGREGEIRTGSIAEVDGRFKFISFIRD